MSKAKHTPGPWEVGRYGYNQLSVFSGPDNDAEHVAEAQLSIADARLIAAAPRMLHALKVAHDMLAGHGLEADALDVIRAAIAEAAGEA